MGEGTPSRFGRPERERDFGVLSTDLRPQLMSVLPSSDGYMEYRPCRVTLTDGRVVDRVYVAECRSYVADWGIWPDEDKGKRSLRIEDVVKIEESPVRLPAHLANKMYQAGESAMGGCIFTLVLEDGRELPVLTGNAVDFVDLPADVTPDQIVDLIPHKGREAEGRLPGADYYWCLYRDESLGHKDRPLMLPSEVDGEMLAALVVDPSSGSHAEITTFCGRARFADGQLVITREKEGHDQDILVVPESAWGRIRPVGQGADPSLFGGCRYSVAWTGSGRREEGPEQK